MHVTVAANTRRLMVRGDSAVSYGTGSELGKYEDNLGDFPHSRSLQGPQFMPSRNSSQSA
jgi:hypothetical protein